MNAIYKSLKTPILCNLKTWDKSLTHNSTHKRVSVSLYPWTPLIESMIMVMQEVTSWTWVVSNHYCSRNQALDKVYSLEIVVVVTLRLPWIHQNLTILALMPSFLEVNRKLLIKVVMVVIKEVYLVAMVVWSTM